MTVYSAASASEFSHWQAGREPTSAAEVIDALFELQGLGWLSRGVRSDRYALLPKIDRVPLPDTSRQAKLRLERGSIDRFRSSARFFSSDGERPALSDDFIALAVLRHYGVPTRLLDWTSSPFVAAWFAVEESHDPTENRVNAAVFSFDMRPYEHNGRDQWRRWPRTTTDGSGHPDRFRAQLTAFAVEEPIEDWIICMFYPEGFPRQNAQRGAYTATARFGVDHGMMLARLIDRPQACRRITIPNRLKADLRLELQNRHDISRSTLFPDSAGASEWAGEVFRNLA